jgi:hypothetical protein
VGVRRTKSAHKINPGGVHLGGVHRGGYGAQIGANPAQINPNRRKSTPGFKSTATGGANRGDRWGRPVGFRGRGDPVGATRGIGVGKSDRSTGGVRPRKINPGGGDPSKSTPVGFWVLLSGVLSGKSTPVGFWGRVLGQWQINPGGVLGSVANQPRWGSGVANQPRWGSGVGFWGWIQGLTDQSSPGGESTRRGPGGVGATPLPDPTLPLFHKVPFFLIAQWDSIKAQKIFLLFFLPESPRKFCSLRKIICGIPGSARMS